MAFIIQIGNRKRVHGSNDKSHYAGVVGFALLKSVTVAQILTDISIFH